MAFLAAVLPYISLIAGVGGSAMQANAAREAGKAGQEAKEYEADRYEEQAIASVASAQREMLNERRKKELIVSRAQALAAFGGGGVNDPTVQNIIGDLDGEGAYREAVSLYQGEEEARKLNLAAGLSRLEGANIRKGGEAQSRAYAIQGIASAASSASSLYSKYNQGKYNATQAGRNTTLATGTGLNN